MNKARRKKITSVIRTLENIIDYDLIESAKDELEDILYEEEDAYDNMPENLQYSIRGEESSEAIDNLQEAVDLLEEAIDIINDINDINDEDDEDNEKESKIDEINDYINQVIDALEQII